MNSDIFFRPILLIFVNFSVVFAAGASPVEMLEEKMKSSQWRSDQIRRSDDEWQRRLGSSKFSVLRNRATERPFTSEYINSKDKGVFVCGACGLELFSSDDKFDSGTGWPSFTKPSGTDTLYYKSDGSIGEQRVEVLCARCGSHLGHVFPRGTGTDDLRYCINGTALELKKGDVGGVRAFDTPTSEP